MKPLARFTLMSQAEKDKVREEIIAHCTLLADCWVYQTRNSAGYGVKRINGKVMSVSRFMLSYSTRESLSVPHDACHAESCPYRACCNPKHLLWGSHQENAEQREKAARERRKMDVVVPPVSLGHVTHEECQGIQSVDVTLQHGGRAVERTGLHVTPLYSQQLDFPTAQAV